MGTLVWCVGVGVVSLVVGYLLAVVRSSSRLHAAEVRVARAEAELSAQGRGAAERLRSLQEDSDRLSDQFRALAADALAANNEQFLGLAEHRLRSTQVAGQADMAKRAEAVNAMVEPLTRTLMDVRQQMVAAEEARIASAAALGEQVRGMRETSELLRTETGTLVTALRASDVRGAWGEMQLRRVVEAAGMLNRVDFVEQSSVHTDDGDLRPDMVVHLAGGKRVVVDAKVAFLGYLDAQQTSDPVRRAERLAAHARHVRKHIDDLSGKRYWDQFSPAPEFVVMFIPAESFLSAAVDEDPSLLEYAFGRNVVIVTPMTLMALLRTVAYAWRQDALAENAQKVLTIGKELHGRLATMGMHLNRLGRQIQGAADSYNKTVASLETRVLVSARRFAELDIVDETLESPTPVNPQLSALSSPELLASVDETFVDIGDGRRS
ncbi:DNA recombination protein RmuC [Sanguibacter antarcticus]|uniref:DNA recombination protein RmuC n=1 Tax=Sanguibacter antarcticus TaxID=372484 RepID=A0A2A9E6G9_9MICO|nr:DNA recombination protein RmuC [Sanguibacter antarcticus]PFG33799.1 DNA recombination protein RmuC [Sanguibacter antarcticus]